jgi:putative ABC transport system substrate-binding protein
MLLSRHTRRRGFITLLGGAAAWPFGAGAQQRKAIRRIGLLLGSGSDPLVRTWVAAFQEGLRQAGWIDNDNLASNCALQEMPAVFGHPLRNWSS